MNQCKRFLTSRSTVVPPSALYLNLLAVLCALTQPQLSWAQTSGPETASGGGTLEEIVVTARRREENLQDTPLSVTAFSGEALNRRFIANATDLGRVTPNLQLNSTAPASGSNSSVQTFIRGIGQSDPLPGVDPGVGIYVDEVYLARSVGSAIDFLDVESVQVLRGPQGTLFGRNTIGGAVLVSTKDPSDEAEVETRLGIGSDSLIEGFAAGNVQLGSNLSSRLSLGFRRRDGFVTEVPTGRDLGDDDAFMGRVKLLWSASDSLSLTLSAGYIKEDENGAPLVFAESVPDAGLGFVANLRSGCVAAGNVFDETNPNCFNDQWDGGPYRSNGTFEATSEYEGRDISLTASWDLSERILLKSITAYRDTEWQGARDADHSPLTVVHTEIDAEQDQFSQELQLQYNSERLAGVTGLFYFEESASDFFRIALPGPAPGPGPVRNDAAFDNDNFALFTQWTYSATESLDLTLGARYTDETKGFNGNQFNESSGALFISRDNFEESFNNVSFAGSVMYRINDDSQVYVSYSEGFKSGGLVSRYAAPIPGGNALDFDEEQAVTYELGYKADLMAGRLRLNAALFTSDYQDIQVAFRLGPTPTIFNAGNATIDGFELEWTFLPTSRVIFEGGVGYLDTGYDSIRQPDPVLGVPVTGGIPDGAELAYAPEWSVHADVGYRFDLGSLGSVEARLGTSYQSAVFFDAVNSPEVAQNDDINIWNLTARYEGNDGRWSGSFGILNLNDEEYRVAGFSSLGSAGYAEAAWVRGREWRLSVGYSF